MSGTIDPTAVSFDYGLWCLRFPELASVPETLADQYFLDACDQFNNSARVGITDPARRLRLLNLLTAHLAKLNATINGVAPSGMVGRVSSAAEGSVSVSTDFASGGSAQEAYYSQTPYGVQFWASTAGLRMARYLPGPGQQIPLSMYKFRPYGIR
jgi:hypothetical protein